MAVCLVEDQLAEYPHRETCMDPVPSHGSGLEPRTGQGSAGQALTLHSSGNAKAKVIVPEARPEKTAVRRPATAGVHVPTSAPDYPVGELRVAAKRIYLGRMEIVGTVEGIPGPLPDISMHAVKTELVALGLADGMGPTIGILDEPSVTGEFLFAPLEAISSRSAGAAGVFPLGLGRQAKAVAPGDLDPLALDLVKGIDPLGLAQSIAELYGFEPIHVLDREPQSVSSDHLVLAGTLGGEPARVLASQLSVLPLRYLMDSQIERLTDCHLMPGMLVFLAFPLGRAHQETAGGDQLERYLGRLGNDGVDRFEEGLDWGGIGEVGDRLDLLRLGRDGFDSELGWVGLRFQPFRLFLKRDAIKELGQFVRVSGAACRSTVEGASGSFASPVAII
jgi:hypothetical protein